MKPSLFFNCFYKFEIFHSLTSFMIFNLWNQNKWFDLNSLSKKWFLKIFLQKPQGNPPLDEVYILEEFIVYFSQ